MADKDLIRDLMVRGIIGINDDERVNPRISSSTSRLMWILVRQADLMISRMQSTTVPQPSR